MEPSLGIIFAVMTVLTQAMTVLGLDKHNEYDREQILLWCSECLLLRVKENQTWVWWPLVK